MNILIIGGTGPIGAYTALHLLGEGHEVTISSRNPPRPDEPLGGLPWMAGNYLEESYSAEALNPFDAIVFAAGSDIRHVPAGEDPDEHYLWANGEMVPKFAALARDAGVKTFVHIGSFYAHILKSEIDKDAYIRSRHLAANGVCDLSSNSFRALSLDAPFVVGVPDGMKNDMFMAYASYAKGIHAHVPPFGPAGGTNFMSARSLAQAVSGAIENGVGGQAYLVGDENLSFAAFFKLFFDAVGNPAEVPVLDQEHPMLPDSAIMQGRGNVISYEPSPETLKQLGYERNNVGAAVKEMVASFDKILGTIEPYNLSAQARSDKTFQDLAILYAQAMDKNDMDLLRDICTDDIVVEGPGFSYAGEDVFGIGAMLQMFFAKTRHVVQQQLVDIDDVTAIAETLCSAQHVTHSSDPTSQSRELVTMEIRYQDKFRHQGDSWKFSRRSLIVDWMEVRPIKISL